MRRVLVTGSRNLTRFNAVWNELEAELYEHGGPILVIHGGCGEKRPYKGADGAADQWARDHGWEPKVILADWERPCTEHCYHKPRWKHGRRYCPVAGNLRNQELVDFGADVCLAFPWGKSPGTRDCIARAEAAGIPVKVFEQ